MSNEPAPPANPVSSWPTTVRWTIALALLATLALLALHVAEYRFLTDDAFISFRYARNLSDGHGLVFNPGFERVEGYSNFLWVLLLAGFQTLGVRPEIAAQFLSLLATLALWALVAWFALRHPPRRGREGLVLFPLLCLAATRSFAVWSTSGLETRLFELLILGAALRLLAETEASLQSRRAIFAAGWLFALATLTRPDGLMLSGIALGVGSLVLIGRRKLTLRNGTAWWAPYLAIVGGHFLFRRIYYQQWLPNTYYAKVDGRTWWDSGVNYLTAFALEYAAYLWIPLAVAAFVLRAKGKTLRVPLLFASLVLSHALYVASIGGDHFEYRPLNLYFPFVFLLLYDGARQLATTPRRTAAVGVYLLVVLIGLWQLPSQSHRQFPSHPLPGFPRFYGDDVEGARAFLDPDRDPVYRWPGLREIAQAHRERLREMTSHFVGLRQEEHRFWLPKFAREGRALRELVDSGRLPEGAYIATRAAGAIPYYSRLRTLDRLGLTDAAVAHQPFADENFRVMAHSKVASLAYARERGVELWAVGPVFLLHSPDSEILMDAVAAAQFDANTAQAAAYVGNDYFLLATLPLGLERTRRHLEGLDLRACNDPVFVAQFAEKALPLYQARVRRDSLDTEARLALARLRMWTGDYQLALRHLDVLTSQTPDDIDLWYFTALCLREVGEQDRARAALRRCLEIARAHGNERRVRLIEGWLQP